VASNLPDGDAEGGGEERQSQSAETRERVNFDFSATERQVERAPGAVERITVAVLVDGVREAGEDGVAEWAPRPQDELEAIRELVQSAVGFDADRGDVVTVRTMRFDLPSAPEAAPGLSLPWFTGGQLTQLGIAALLAITAIAVAAFVIRPLLSKGGASSAPSATGLSAPDGAAPVGSAAGVGNLLAPPAVPDASPSTTVPGALPSPTEAPPNFAPAISLAGLDDLPSDGSATSEDDPVDRLRQLISERREETLEVLRGWMDDKPEDAR
jgi:flagellar M-ring protein FliF